MNNILIKIEDYKNTITDLREENKILNIEYKELLDELDSLKQDIKYLQ